MGSDRTQGSPALIPYPRQLIRGGGVLEVACAPLAVSYSAARSARMEAAAARFAGTLPAASGGASPSLPIRVHCAALAQRYPSLGVVENYRLNVHSQGVDIEAPSEWGVLHAFTTLTQLAGDDGVLPLCRVDDGPRYPWRGLLLDVARHFMDVDALRRTIDGMAYCKLNVLHLHLTDDQAFRFPSASLAMPDEQQYSAQDLADLVTYAAERGIRLVPEVDMPGHVTALVAAHPHLGTQAVDPSARFGVHPACLDPTREAVYSAVGQLLGEVAEIFPDAYLHIGGDEVSPRAWRDSEAVAGYLEEQGVLDLAALQARFMNRVGNMMRDLGRIPLGWDEALHPDLAEQFVVQCWRGARQRDLALANGRQVVLSANYYLDLFYPADVHYGFDPEASLQELEAAEDALLEDARLSHVAHGMRWTQHWREAQAQGTLGGEVLGGEACLWSELVTQSLLDVRLWTRLPAVAERLWSPPEQSDTADFYERMDRWLVRLPEAAGIDIAASVRSHMADVPVADQWLALVDLLEPVKWYARLLGEDAMRARLSGREMPMARPYDANTPLNAIVDGLPPESFVVREVEAICRLVHQGDESALGQLRALIDGWRELAALDGCPPAIVGCQRQLGEVVHCLAAHLDGADRAETLARLRRLNEPQGEYMLALIPMLCRWLEPPG